ncbi:MAG: LysR family transcriptional regulator [Lachnospiraceae bacterium]|nr:LysR family transcriptional regulator [Lachnospiraceae bacterium]
MDMEGLRTFLVLANTKNYTRAAAQLFVAQSTVTNRIAELERELGVSLFDRTNRKVGLTLEGEKFRIYADNVMELTESALAEITEAKRFDSHLRIGSADSIYEGHLASKILLYRQDHPRDSLRISIGVTSHLLEQLQADMLDVVFVYLPLAKSGYHSKLYKKDELVLVTDVDNDQYKDGITEQQLTGVNYLMCNFALQEVGQYIRKLFPRFHQFELEIDDCMKIVPFLLHQDTYTFLPKDMAEPYIARGELREIRLLDFRTPVINSYIICKRSAEEMCRRIFM